MLVEIPTMCVSPIEDGRHSQENLVKDNKYSVYSWNFESFVTFSFFNG